VDEALVDDEDRKGRLSVEEIISFFFYRSTGCQSCSLHGCGREDIDVRMLGNGRPFALQITRAKRKIGPELLESISKAINGFEEINSEGDVAVSCLKEVWNDSSIN
jgi:tRNA U54 and U55 pseudouridine synthase Pus10